MSLYNQPQQVKLTTYPQLSENVEYQFEITDVKVDENVVVSIKALPELRGKSLSNMSPEQAALIPKDYCADYLRLSLKESETGATFYDSVPLSSIRLTTDPSRRSKLTQLILALGAQIADGTSIVIADWVKPGVRFKAHVALKNGKYPKLIIPSVRRVV